MKLNPKNILFGDDTEKKPVLLTVTPPRTGERTLLGVENLLQSIAVPEPFSLELAGDMDGVRLMARASTTRWCEGRSPPTTPRRASASSHRRTTRSAWARESRRGPSRCGPTAPSTSPCAPSATTTCSTPAQTPSSPSWGRSPPSTRESAWWRGCCCAPSAPTGPRPTWTRPTRGRAWNRGNPPTPSRPSPCRWTASPWPSSASARWPPSRATYGCRTGRYGRRRSSAWERPWGWPRAAGHGTAGRRPASGSRTRCSYAKKSPASPSTPSFR